MIRNLVIIAAGFLVLACQKKNTEETSRPAGSGVSYAQRFSMEEYEGYNVLTVNKLWQGSDESASYLLYEGEVPTAIDASQYTLIPYPVQSIVSNSTTHLAFLEILGVEQRLKGFAQTQYIYSESIRSQLDQGLLQEVGHEGQLDVERILGIDPDVILAFSSGSENRQLAKLEELGQPVVMTPDYLEPDILGRAEWIKFIGHLTGKEDEAEAYFSQIAAAYDSLTTMVNDVERPSVFSGTLYGGTWFMPAGNNYNALLMKDAGAEYLWTDAAGTGWINLDFEAVYAKAYQADFWIGVADYQSIEALVAADERYANFEAVKTGQVYGYTKRMSTSGGNDYFESGNANPHLLLADHIKILHPELLPDYELFYYKKLE
ncbi:ABC transporter substrate-binding protein [Reichenbachiella ulvae]|uniref:ABC transporter substrate-binding protein n=1 Tax=Reichenbachiella ulvae TaxID=2980104 RepID=A0ABT3CRX1_9BACT|nr:ABC transporter substrate-binding protein [Reichenbachiella ulvae]MCV9386433.1 ABC transporter substrate-binding protein [Reichenbachiella ulvae]